MSGRDPVCNVAVTDPELAANSGSTARTHPTRREPRLPAARGAAANAHGKPIRAVYVPDAELGTRWFADKSIWVRDGGNYLPFTTHAAAQRYSGAHPGATVVDYEQALVGAV